MFADIGYGLTIFGYLGLTALLVISRNKSLIKYLLILPVLGMVFWAMASAYLPLYFSHTMQIVLFDSLKMAAWLVFLGACLRPDDSKLQHVLRRPQFVLLLVLPILSCSIIFLAKVPVQWLFVLTTLMALQVLILLELLYRQAAQQKWAYKPLVLFLGTLALLDFVLYANAIMVNHLDQLYAVSRAYVYVLIAPLLVLSVRRIRHWGISIYISRDIVLHSTLLIMAGAYLFGMALIGYAVKYFGGEWSYALQLIIATSGLLVLAALFLSNKLRSQVKVFITKHFYENQFDYRREWVKLTKHLNEHSAQLDDIYNNALQGILNAVSYQSGHLLKYQNGDFSSLTYYPSSETSKPLNQQQTADLHHYFAQKSWVIDIDELRVKPHMYNELNNRESFIEGFDYHLIVPIFRQESLWGLCLLNANASHVKLLNWEFRDYIQAVSDQVANYIFQHEDALALAENAQFAAFSRMSAFVLHDLKNVLAQIDLILANAQQHKNNPEFIEDTFETLEHTKQRMHKMLSQLTEKNSPRQTGTSQADLTELIGKVIRHQCQGLNPVPVFVQAERIYAQVDSEKFANVMYHLINNAQQATSDKGEVNIGLTQQNGFAVIKVSDTGSGMTQDFIKSRLFKPFDTTKGNAGMGIGAYDAKQYIEQIGGSIAVESEVEAGTTFILHLPLASKKEQGNG